MVLLQGAGGGVDVPLACCIVEMCIRDRAGTDRMELYSTVNAAGDQMMLVSLLSLIHI